MGGVRSDRVAGTAPLRRGFGGGRAWQMRRLLRVWFPPARDDVEHVDAAASNSCQVGQVRRSLAGLVVRLGTALHPTCAGKGVLCHAQADTLLAKSIKESVQKSLLLLTHVQLNPHNVA